MQPSPSRRARYAPLRQGLAFVACRNGVAALELGLVAGPLVMLLIGIIQFVLLQYTQNILNNALYDSAAMPESSLISNNKGDYKANVCNKIIVMSVAQCSDKIVVEMDILKNFSTTAASIKTTSFSSGDVGDVVLLRASLPVTQFVPFIPEMSAKASVVFRR